MTYQLVLNIQEDSPEGKNIESLATSQHVSREEAALKLLAAIAPSANAPARRLFGALREDAGVVDEALELAMEDRRRRNATSTNE